MTTTNAGHVRGGLETGRPGRTTVLIRHSEPEVDAELPAWEWRLSAEGIERCERMASDMERFLPATLLSSPEIKAMQTAEVIGAKLGLKPSARDGLRERRRPARFLPAEEFHRNAREFFDNPGIAASGGESRERVAERIESEIRLALAENPTGNVLLVTHGMAMTGFLGRHNCIDAYGVWNYLGLPCWVALDVPTFGIVECDGVDDGAFDKTYGGD